MELVLPTSQCVLNHVIHWNYGRLTYSVRPQHVPLIVSLVTCVSPLAVRRLVVTVWILAVERLTYRPRSHVIEEVLEAGSAPPPKANAYAAILIMLYDFRILILEAASAMHTVPARILRRRLRVALTIAAYVRSPMAEGRRISMTDFCALTSAMAEHTSRERGTPSCNLDAARAVTQINVALQFFANCEPTEPSTDETKAAWHNPTKGCDVNFPRASFAGGTLEV